MDDLSLQVNSIIMSDDVSINSDFSSINMKLGENSTGSASDCYYTYIKNIASNVHPRFNLYKKTFVSNQEERRRQLLLEQKK